MDCQVWLERPGAELIAFHLSASGHRVGEGWSRKHADTQRRLCDQYLAPVIGHLACEDIKAADMQAAVNAAPTAGGGRPGRRCFAAYTGLRWGELAALTTTQISAATRTVDVDRKVIEIGGTLFTEAPKGRKRRRTIYPAPLPSATPRRRMSPPALSRPAPSSRTAPARSG